MNFDFANPNLLWLLLLLPLLALLRSASGKSGSIIFSSVAIAKEAAGKNKAKAGAWKFTLTLVALALMITALARPRIGRGYSEREESGIDIVLAVDVSASMAALDFSRNASAPITRMDAVKDVIRTFVKKRPNDRIGMITFATNPFIVSPMTLDHNWLEKNFERVDIGIIAADSTAIGTALTTAVNRLKKLRNAKSRVVILLTDGENNAGQITPVAAAEAAASFDTKVYTIAVGRSGIVPAARLDENGRIIRDNYNRPVYAGNMRSSVDETTLKKIAEITGGKFYRAENLDELKNIYSDIDSLEKTSVKLRNFTSYEELFQWFAGAALAVLAVKLLLINTRLRTLP